MPDSVRVTVEIRLDEAGNVWSSHDAATPEDAEAIKQLSGGGHRHIAHSLLTEAIRREAFVCLMVAMSNDPGLSLFHEKAETYQMQMTMEIAKAVGQSLAANMGPMILPSVREALEMLRSGVD